MKRKRNWIFTKQLFVGHYNRIVLNDDIDASLNLLDDYHNNDDILKNRRSRNISFSLYLTINHD
jgi:hypothetical protein